MSSSRVLVDDGRILGVDKPPGLPVIPGRDGGPSLRTELERERGERLLVVHRLDVGTSGVVLFARDPDAHRHLSQAFESRQVEKTYLAIVRGEPAWDEQVVDLPLREARRGKARPAATGEDGKAALTELRVLARFGTHALVEARPRTGRHHQIRVHLRSTGFPLLFDPQYGDTDAPIARTPLHASRLLVPHPAGGRLALEAPLPADMQTLLERRQ